MLPKEDLHDKLKAQSDKFNKRNVVTADVLGTLHLQTKSSNGALSLQSRKKAPVKIQDSMT